LAVESQFVPASAKNTVSHADVDKLDAREGTIDREQIIGPQALFATNLVPRKWPVNSLRE
jgi:hypothetical protein